MKQWSISKLKTTAIALSICLLTNTMGILPLALAGNVLTGDIRITVTPAEIDKLVPITGGQKTITMSLHGVSLHDAFRALAKQGGFSVMVDESVDGSINVDLKQVTIQDALETFKTFGNLAYSVQNNQLIVAKADSLKAKGFERSHSKIIPLRYTNALVVAQMLNQVLYGDPGGQQGGGGQNSQAALKVSYDTQTNSLIVVGTPNDIKTVEKHVDALDAPRETKTWRLSHANALQVASMLSSSLFNEGIPGVSLSGSAGGSTGAGGLASATLKVQNEKVQEGAGSNASGGASSSTSVGNSITLRGQVKEELNIQISPQGPIVLPDTRLNTITVMGTAQQIAMAEAMIPVLDRKVPQVLLEVSLIEMTERQRRNIEPRIGATANEFLGGVNNVAGSTPFSNAIGIATPLREVLLGYTTNPVRRLREDFKFQLDMLVRQDKLKLLANPSIITSHDNEAVVSMVDEIIRRNELTVNAAGGLVGSQAEIGEVGIVLNMLPKVGPNGTIQLRVHPTISTLADRRFDTFGGQINLLSRRDLMVQNIILKEGESFILGGLVNNTDNNMVGKFPGLGDLPIAGALMRSTNRNSRKSELIIVITPHILNDQSDMARQSAHDPMIPVNLKSAPGEKQESQYFIPVSNSGLLNESSPNSSLPPLESPRTLNTSYTHGAPQRVALEGKFENSEKKAHSNGQGVPLLEQLPQAMIMLKQDLKNQDTNKQDTKKPVKAVPSSSSTLSGPDVSDDTIRAIINRFGQ